MGRVVIGGMSCSGSPRRSLRVGVASNSATIRTEPPLWHSAEYCCMARDLKVDVGRDGLEEEEEGGEEEEVDVGDVGLEEEAEGLGG
jgi:hypothetical protein